MSNAKVIETKESNYCIKARGIPKGCQLCLKGLKSVLFLNGLCQKPDQCAWYCPLSEERRNKSNTFINEIQITDNAELIEEIDKSGSQGISITGGEPFFGQNPQKTLRYINLLKNKFGEEFHIHLYTNGIGFTETIANKLSETGLDEIRFHPPQDTWTNIKKALKKGLTVGAEVPLIPNSIYLAELKELVVYLDQIGAEFINLNEFEYCFPNSRSLKEKGYILKEESIASVQNSREEAYKFMEQMKSDVSLKMHFCSIRAKDYYQLKNRYYRRAKHIKQPYEEITEEGLLIYGQIEGERDELVDLYDELRYESQLPLSFIEFAKDKIFLPYYLLIDDEFLEFFNQFNLEGFIVETLPFRRDRYRQITEKTPIYVFKEELYENED
jgi:hypothetical protein